MKPQKLLSSVNKGLKVVFLENVNLCSLTDEGHSSVIYNLQFINFHGMAEGCANSEPFSKISSFFVRANSVHGPLLTTILALEVLN